MQSNLFARNIGKYLVVEFKANTPLNQASNNHPTYSTPCCRIVKLMDFDSRGLYLTEIYTVRAQRILEDKEENRVDPTLKSLLDLTENGGRGCTKGSYVIWLRIESLIEHFISWNQIVEAHELLYDINQLWKLKEEEESEKVGTLLKIAGSHQALENKD